MFRKLKIQNYILIDKVEVLFSENFNVITGETGAGKSVLLGALSLLSGQRAESSVLKDKTQKCFIEAEIFLPNSNLEPFFREHDLDFERETIIRREINPGGKSRAFINDSPVVLKVLEQFANLFFDLHSQDQNRLIKDDSFRLSLVDTIAKSSKELKQYQNCLLEYNELNKQIQKIISENNKIQKELDFIQFQYQQLDDAKLQEENEQDLLEDELKQLNHAEEIKQALTVSHAYISGNDESIISHLIRVEQELSKLSSYYKNAESYLSRIKSTLIDLQDMAPDLESNAEDVEYNPERIEIINDRLNLLMSLQHKHQVGSVSDLIEIRNELDEKLANFGNSNFEIEEKQKQLAKSKSDLEKASSLLSKKRKSAFKIIEQEVVSTVSHLGIPKARFSIDHQLINSFEPLGQDNISFLFSANKGTELDDMNKIASGGEISRLMLALKQLLSQSTDLSTLILDEIDTGVSGDVADKIGKLMKQISQNRQLIVITHLPQIAAKGDLHFKVKKQENKKTTNTDVILLQENERLSEIAQLLSGENVTNAAFDNAKELINN